MVGIADPESEVTGNDTVEYAVNLVSTLVDTVGGTGTTVPEVKNSPAKIVPKIATAVATTTVIVVGRLIEGLLVTRS